MPHVIAHHGQAGALRRALEAIDLVFCKVEKIQFSAPWRRRRGC